MNVSSLFTSFDTPPGSTGATFDLPLSDHSVTRHGMALLLGAPIVSGVHGSGEQTKEASEAWSAEHLSVSSDLVDVDPYQDFTQIPAVWLTFVFAFGLVWILALTGEFSLTTTPFLL